MMIINRRLYNMIYVLINVTFGTLYYIQENREAQL